MPTERKEYLVHGHMQATPIAFTDDFEQGKQLAKEWSLANPGKRAWVAEVKYSIQIMEHNYG